VPAVLTFRLAVAVVAVHVLADAFTGLEPGVDPGDHLSAALVPLAILAVALAVFPRAPAGARGAIALSLAFLALVGSGIAAATLAADGLDIPVVTGALLLPAGLALGWLGGSLLWQSRKPEGRPLLRRPLIALGAFVLWFSLLVPIAIGLVATHRPAGTVEARDLGRPYEEVTVRTDDDLDLAGWYVPSENGAAVITFPSREGTADHARLLAEAGYGVLALDARGYGESEGDPNAFGWGTAEDIEAAVDFLEARPDVEPGRVGGLGLSVGGEMMIEAAAADERIAAVVSEGAGERSIRETLLFGAEAALVIPQSAVQTAAVAALSGDGPPEALDALAAEISPRALFLIQAEEGQGGEDLNADYADAAGEPKEYWVVEGAGHTGGIDAQPEEYRERVVEFFDAALGVTGR
jgi:dienelactone hydrolase